MLIIIKFLKTCLKILYLCFLAISFLNFFYLLHIYFFCLTMPRTKKILSEEEKQEKIALRKKIVAKYTAKPLSKELAKARQQRYRNNPNSTYNKPREGDAYERQKKSQRKYYQKKKEEKRAAKEINI